MAVLSADVFIADSIVQDDDTVLSIHAAFIIIGEDLNMITLFSAVHPMKGLQHQRRVSDDC